MRADLHIHTTASDGTWSPAELIEEAQKIGLGAIAITDHDSVGNVAEGMRLAKIAGIRFLPGAEICATQGGIQFHILGYGIDITSKPLLELMEHNTLLLEQKDFDTIAILEAEGWPVSQKEFSAYTYDRSRGGFASLAYLIDKGLCTDVYDFFKKVFISEHNLGFPVFPTVTEVVKHIHEAGGVALCAHAASGFHGPGLAKELAVLEGEALDGFECYHSGHNEEDTAQLLALCRNRNLMISGGSDCHGTFVVTRPLGIPYVDTKDLYLPNLL